jgi:hypothetical protein
MPIDLSGIWIETGGSLRVQKMRMDDFSGDISGYINIDPTINPQLLLSDGLPTEINNLVLHNNRVELFDNTGTGTITSLKNATLEYINNTDSTPLTISSTLTPIILTTTDDITLTASGEILLTSTGDITLTPTTSVILSTQIQMPTTSGTISYSSITGRLSIDFASQSTGYFELSNLPAATITGLTLTNGRIGGEYHILLRGQLGFGFNPSPFNATYKINTYSLSTANGDQWIGLKIYYTNTLSQYLINATLYSNS